MFDCDGREHVSIFLGVRCPVLRTSGGGKSSLPARQLGAGRTGSGAVATVSSGTELRDKTSRLAWTYGNIGVLIVRLGTGTKRT